MGFNSGASQATLDAVKAKTDNLPASPANETTVAAVKTKTDLIPASPASETTVAAVKTKTDLIPASPASETTVAELVTAKGRQLFSMDFWSDPQEEVAIPAVAGTLTLPSVTVADLPSGAVVVRAVAMVKFRVIENINAGANKLDGATVAGTSQVIQVRDDTPGTWRDAIKFVDDQFGLAASTREGGDVLIGSVDIAVEVDANDTYEFQYLLAKADLLGINWNDVQAGLRIWYSV